MNGSSSFLRASILAGCGFFIGAISYANPPVAQSQATAPLATTPQRLHGLRAPPVTAESKSTTPPTDYPYLDFRADEAAPDTGLERVLPEAYSGPATKSGRQSADSGPVTNVITPLCTMLSVNTAYTLSGTATGGSYCYGFQITQRSKTQVFLIGQNPSTNFALTLIRHEENDTLTVVGGTDNPGNTNEVFFALTQPGTYYWLMDANASDGSAFQFGAITNTAADAYEVNDDPAHATVVSDDRTPFTGNMDSASDVDYFQYVAQFGQEVFVRLDDTFGLNEWQLQYFNGSAWAPLSVNSDVGISGLPAGATLNLRVLPNPSAALNIAHTYRLTVGSYVRSSDLVNVSSPENLAHVPLSATNPSLVTQAHNLLNWSIRLLDSTGHPVRGVEADFILGAPSEIPLAAHPAFSNAAGIAGGSVTLPNCTGDITVFHTDGGNQWRTEFDAGLWWIEVPHTRPGEVGVGGNNVPNVVFGHICRQTLQ